jgi:hypothetical protein
MASTATTTATATKFEHIYYSDWLPGATYERKIKGGVVMLGRLVSKKLCGRTYDPDILLTFERVDGTKYQHVVEFDSSYRRVITSIITSV